MTHDEVLMLIIACAVIVQIGATFKYLRRIPHFNLLLASFVASALSSLFTVVEGIFWAGPFNLFEHFALMIGAIFFALWCGLVFRRPKQKAP